MPVYPVSLKKNEALQSKIESLGLRGNDFEEVFTRSQGAGGQNVNKVASCVLLRHRPTGLMVRCQRERSQALNRFLAMRLLVDKIEALQKGVRTSQEQAREKIRRQKRRRGRRAKETMLREKKIHSQKKALRRSVEDF